MIPVLQVKNSNGEWISIPAIQGKTGDSGVYLGSQEPSNDAKVWIDTENDPILRIKDENGNWVAVPAIQGEPGVTPEKGVDYWTDADKQEIINDIPLGAGLTKDENNNITIKTSNYSPIDINDATGALEYKWVPEDNAIDWEENNWTSIKYISNKPFYETQVNRILSHRSLEFVPQEGGTLAKANLEWSTISRPLYRGAKHIVVWDGITYECEAYTSGFGEDMVVLIGGGNSYPFTISSHYNYSTGEFSVPLAIYSNDTEINTHTVSIQTKQELKQIPSKFIPNNLQQDLNTINLEPNINHYYVAPELPVKATTEALNWAGGPPCVRALYDKVVVNRDTNSVTITTSVGTYVGTINKVMVPAKGVYYYTGFIADNPIKGNPDFTQPIVGAIWAGSAPIDSAYGEAEMIIYFSSSLVSKDTEIIVTQTNYGEFTCVSKEELPEGWAATLTIDVTDGFNGLTSDIIAEKSINGIELDKITEHFSNGAIYIQLMKRPKTNILDWFIPVPAAAALPVAEAATF